MNFLKFLLMPFSVVYWAATSFRNYLYDTGRRKSFHFETRTICVGNLAVGGTGKTPMVEYLVNLLNNTYVVAILSRGYGRKSKGFIMAKDGVSVNDIGDESFQYFTKFKNNTNVAVGEQRILAIPSILLEVPSTDVIILDDAFQHRQVICDINIVITDFNHLFFQDFLMPSGRLREWRSGISRANIAVVSKCPDRLHQNQIDHVASEIKKYSKKEIPVFFTKVVYGNPIKIFDEPQKDLSEKVILITGIAKPEPFQDYITERFKLIEVYKYRDHHDYTSKDLHHISDLYKKYQNQDVCIITTEKDMVKLKDHQDKSLISDLPIFYIPITVDFLFGKDAFNEYILNYMEKNNY